MYSDKILRSVSKPGRYCGGEFGQVVKDKSKLSARMVFCFPDTYEIGMSNSAVRLSCRSAQSQRGFLVERAYAPWTDMEEKLRAEKLPLLSQESGDPLDCFDIVAFTLQYELCYTNVLNMLELGRIPLLASDRGEDDPVVIGGGPCAYNAEPVADFFDCFSIGEGEEALCEFADLYIRMKKSGEYTRERFLREVSHLEGFYVPSLYEVSYKPDGTLDRCSPSYPDVPARVRKRIISDMDKAYFPDKLVMPYIETVQDRIMLEVYRGCIRGCRFCQAGMIFRPVREKSPETLDCQARKLCDSTGYSEISLSSLSISDYSKLDELCDKLLSWTDERRVSLSLPSLRVDSFTKELMDKVSSVRSSGLTFAPEAGTQRLRDAINKNVDEADLLRACNVAFDAGKNQVKLYFMMGLPTETYEDLDGIAKLAADVVDAYYHNPNRPKRPPTVTISVACFIPKPFTPFQWEAQDGYDELCGKQKYLGSKITDRKVKYNYHDASTSRVEAVFARGDRRLSKALLKAHEMGLRFDAWDEYFDYAKWLEAFEDCGIDPSFYANREFGADETLPWDVIDIGVTKEFLRRERDKAYKSETTPNCRQQCSGCGANSLGGERSVCPKK